MTVLKCDRCGAVQKDPKNLEGWVEAEMTAYEKLGDCIAVHEHWCPKCNKEIGYVRYADEYKHKQLMQDPLSRSVFGNGGTV